MVKNLLTNKEGYRNERNPILILTTNHKFSFWLNNFQKVGEGLAQIKGFRGDLSSRGDWKNSGGVWKFRRKLGSKVGKFKKIRLRRAIFLSFQAYIEIYYQFHWKNTAFSIDFSDIIQQHHNLYSHDLLILDYSLSSHQVQLHWQFDNDYIDFMI